VRTCPDGKSSGLCTRYLIQEEVTSKGITYSVAFFGCLSAARFTRMTATTLPFTYFNHIIAKNEVELLMERHRD